MDLDCYKAKCSRTHSHHLWKTTLWVSPLSFDLWITSQVDTKHELCCGVSKCQTGVFYAGKMRKRWITHWCIVPSLGMFGHPSFRVLVFMPSKVRDPFECWRPPDPPPKGKTLWRMLFFAVIWARAKQLYPWGQGSKQGSRSFEYQGIFISLVICHGGV